MRRDAYLVFERLELRQLLAAYDSFGNYLASTLTTIQGDTSAATANQLPIIGGALGNYARNSLFQVLVSKAATVPDGSNTSAELATSIVNALAPAVSPTGNVSATPDGQFVDVIVRDTASLQISQFTAGLGLLGFAGSLNFRADADYSLRLRVGINGSKFAIDASQTDLTLGVKVPYAGNLSAFSGTFGVFNALATPEGSGNALDLTFLVDPTGGIIDQGAAVPVTSTVYGGANIEYDLSLGFKAATGGFDPRLQTDVVISWPFGTSQSPTSAIAAADQFGQAPTVTFEDVRLDLGSFLASLAKPAADKILELGQPVFAITKYFDQTIPALEAISSQIYGLTGDIPPNTITEIDQINAFLNKGKGPTLSTLLREGAKVGMAFGKLSLDDVQDINSVLDAIAKINQVAVLASDIQQAGQATNAGTVLHFGDFTIGGPGSVDNLRSSGKSLDETTVQSPEPPSLPVGEQPGVDVLDSLTANGLSIPFLSDPTQVFQILLGNEVTLFEYKKDIPVDGLDGSKYVLFNRNFLIGVVPANVQIAATIPRFAFHLNFGIDTSGLLSGKPLDGIFVAAGSNNPVFNASATLNVDFAIGADASVVVARAGIRGQITVDAQANFPSTSADAKLHLNKFSTSCPLAGSIDVGANVQAFAEAGLNFSLESLKELVESLIASNPTIYSAEKLYAAAQQIAAANGIELPDFDPKGGLTAIGNAFGEAGVKVSDTYKEAEKGVNRFLGQTGEAISSGAEAVGNAILTGGGAWGLTDGITVGGETHRFVYGPVNLFHWETGQCGASGVTSDASSGTPVSQPKLATLSGDVLTLLVGDLGSQRSVSWDIIDEVYTIRPADPNNASNGSVIVTAFGVSQRFDGVRIILADAGSGNDTIDARGTGVVVNFTGGIGNDVLYGGLGKATLSGGAGNDTLYGGPNDDVLNGDAGNDTIYGGAGNDAIDGGSGDDILNGDFARGTAEDDATNPALYGNDTIDGGPGRDRIYGGPGDDILNGGDETDEIFGGTGNDIITAGLVGDLTDDFVNGGAGNDIIYGTAGQNTIYGGSGNDTNYGYGGDDFLSGDTGDDFVYGGDGDDLILVGEGNQTLRGEGDDDIFVLFDLDVAAISGERTVTIDGGSGRNIFYFSGGSLIRSSVVTPDGSTSYTGRNTLRNVQGDALRVNYANIQAHSADTMDRFQLVDPRGGHVLTVSKPVSDPSGVTYSSITANQVSGTRADLFSAVNLGTLDVWGVSNFFIDTSGNIDSTVGDRVTITADGLVAQGLANFSLLTGAGNDTLTINAADFRLPVAGGQFLFDSGSGRFLDTNVPHSNLRGLISLDRIVVNADVDYLLTDVGTRAFDDTPPEGRLMIGPAGSGGAANSTRGSIRLIGVEAATLTGGAGNNRMDASGFSGGLVLNGVGGSDTLIGGSGDNVLDGGDGDDILIAGDDRFARTGLGSQANVLLGGGGKSLLRGGAGRDILYADLGGTATLIGGDDDDTFIITNPAGLVTAPIGGITIDGGGQSGDILRLVGGGGATYNQMYILGAEAGEGRIVTTNNFNPTGPTISQFIRFTGLAAIDDSLTANELTVMGASAPIAGASGADLASGRMRLTVGGSPFAAITFANKTKPSVLLAGGQLVTAAVPTVAEPIAAPPVVTVPPPAMAAAQSTIAPASVAAADTTVPSVQTGTFPAAAATPALVSARPGLAGIRRIGAVRRPAVRPIAHNQSKATPAVRRAASYNHLPKGPLGHKLAPKMAARPRPFAG